MADRDNPVRTLSEADPVGPSTAEAEFRTRRGLRAPGMIQRTALSVAMLLAVNIAPVSGQTTTKLSLLFRNIYGPNGLVVDSEALLPDGSTHSGHFNSGFQSEFSQFNVALASQLTALRNRER